MPSIRWNVLLPKWRHVLRKLVVTHLGDVVYIRLHDVDQTKVDGNNITKNGNVRIACKSGVLQQRYARHNVSIVPDNRELLGLENAFIEWQRMPRITEREAARSISASGGQGHGVIKCNCRAPCKSNRCKCFVSNLFCNSKCHRNNSNGCNHE